MIEEVMELVWPHARDQMEMEKGEFVDMVLYYSAKGYLTLCTEDGKVTGVAFWLRVRDPRNIEHLEYSPKGKFLYCVYAVAKVDMLKNMVAAATKRFPGVEYWTYHRGVKGDDRLRIWRIRNE